jgi:cysteine desulfurase/selenocysteine lyase
MEKIVYLDNGATSFPKPDEVYAFMDSFYRQFGVNPGRSGYDLCVEAGNVLEATRKLLTEFFNGTKPERLCFAYNATAALNMIIFGMLEPGDHAITTNIEHNSVLRPLYHLAQDGVEVDHVPFDSAGFVDPDEIKKLFKKNTKLVIVNHASNVIGTIQPIKEIGAYCREAGIPFAIDASQSAGKIPIDVEEQNIDIVAFTGHKSLMGPTGTGGLYVGEGVEIRHTQAGGTGVKSAVRTHLYEYPWRLEYGTPNTSGIAGLYAGVKWVMEQGLDKIHGHELKLAHKMRDGLQEIPGVVLHCLEDLENHIAVMSFNVEGIEAGNVGTMLDVDYHIACRTGLHCAPIVHDQLGTTKIKGSVRFGLGPLNTEDEIQHAITAVAETATFLRR